MQQSQSYAPAEYQRAPWQTQEAPQFVRFYTYEDYDRAASQLEGRPIIRVKDYVEFPRAGEVDCLRREATEADKHRFPEQWKAYKESREQTPIGTPLATLFPAHPEIVSTLRFFKCHTVEQLAEMSDHGVDKVGLGGFEWRAKARELLKAAEGSQGFHLLKKQLEDRDATILKLQQQMAAMEGRLAAAEAKPKARDDNADALRALQDQVAQILAVQQQPPQSQKSKNKGAE